MKINSLANVSHRLALFGFMLGLSFVPNTALADSVVIDWNKVALQAVRTNSVKQPTVASRAYAIVHTCMYDAWAAYDSVAAGTQLGTSLRRPAIERTLDNKNKAISFAAYRALMDLFHDAPSVAMFNALMTSLGYDSNDLSVNTGTPSGIGNVTSKAVLDFRYYDGSNQHGEKNGGAPYSDYTGYTPVNTPDFVFNPNNWQPLRLPTGLPSPNDFAVQVCVTPQWTHVKPFAMTSGSQFRPKPPEQYGKKGYERQAQDIIDLMAGLDDRRKSIVDYWADNPPKALPPGHWLEFVQAVSHREAYGVDDDAKLFFAVANATFDAGIAVWDAKIFYDYVRPVTAIRYFFAGKQILTWAGPHQGTQMIDGANFRPYQRPAALTPPFPEYPSGHSAFSAASAEVLKSYTGSDAFVAAGTVLAGAIRVEAYDPAIPGTFRVPATDITLPWTTFSQAADEAGMSRRYGGIHFEEGDLESRKIGRKVGAQVWKKARTYFEPGKKDKGEKD